MKVAAINPLSYNQLPDRERQRRRNLLRSLTLVEIVLTLIGATALIGGFLILQADSRFLYATIFIFVEAIALLLATIWLEKNNHYLAATSCLVLCNVIGIIVFISVQGAHSGAIGMMLWPIVLAGFLLNIATVIFLGGLGIILFIAVAILEANNSLPTVVKVDNTTQIFLNGFWWTIIFALLILAVKLFTDNLRKSLEVAETETTNVQQAKQDLEERRKVGQNSGEQVLRLANDLGISSRQQASGATEQVAAVVEVTTSMEELSETARQISLNVQQVADSSVKTLEIAKDVNESTLEATEVAQRGRQVIEASIQGIEQVRNRIEALAQRLLVLTERSEEIGAIIDVINGIADETHLLALNAAIESAGAGEAGRRFAVVASEIKNLADRSIEATRDVRRIIVEVQGAVASAVLVAEEGKKETVRAVERSYQSGLAINEIGHVVNLTSNKGANIVEYVENVNRLTEEIRLATRQQQSASNQIVSTMRSIGEVAQQSASSSTSLNFTIENLRELSRQLTGVLTN